MLDVWLSQTVSMGESLPFTYRDPQPGMSPRLPHNGVSLLSQLTVVGHDGNRTEALPPLEFGYTHFMPGRQQFSSVQGADLPAHSLANPDLALVDLDAGWDGSRARVP